MSSISSLNGLRKLEEFWWRHRLDKLPMSVYFARKAGEITEIRLTTAGYAQWVRALEAEGLTPEALGIRLLEVNTVTTAQ